MDAWMASKQIHIAEFKPVNFAEQLWRPYFDLSETLFRESGERGQPPDRESLKRMLCADNPLYAVTRWIAWDGSRQAALAHASLAHDTPLSPDHAESRHLCRIHVAVAPANRRNKIATRLIRQAIEEAKRLEKDAVEGEADNPDGIQFCRFFKGRLLHREVEHRLYLEDLDWRLVDKWRLRGGKGGRDTKVELFQECPEKDIREFCRVYTEIINQRPVGDIQENLITTPESRRIEERNLKSRGVVWHTMVAREADGHISAVTDIMVDPREPMRIRQYFTGVLARYRKRGLAKRLKAEMLVFVKENYPEAEVVTTTTAVENAPMRAINKQLGFVPQKIRHNYRWDIKALERRVNRVLSGSKKVTLPAKTL